jgi:hypothetical protein
MKIRYKPLKNSLAATAKEMAAVLKIAARNNATTLP